jgi:hypothetical protein
VHLILFETAGNQKYIFDTNKLREHIGASQRILEASTTYVVDAVAELTSRGDGAQAEIIALTSGRALILASDEIAKELVTRVTARIGREACGLDMLGAICAFEPSAESVSERLTDLYAQFDAVRAERPASTFRHPMLPIVRPCDFSGRPAGGTVVVGDDRYWISHESASKTEPELLSRARLRMAHTAYPDDEGTRHAMLTYLHELEYRIDSDARWIAVIHADGNGLGKIFMSLSEDLREVGGYRSYAERYRNLSAAIDRCATSAFRSAISAFRNEPHIIPLIVGGDDLTVVCDAKRSFTFAREYLRAFAVETAADPVIRAVTDRILDAVPAGLSACAGIAICKPRFPFYAAYAIAAELCENAKQVKVRMLCEDGRSVSTSALDFQVLFDGPSNRLSGIRRKLASRADDRQTTALFGGPYVVHMASNGKLEDAADRWAAMHDFDGLERVCAEISRSDGDGRRLLPNAKLHELRSAVFRGKEASDAVVRRLQPRYGDRGIDEVAPGGTLFRSDGERLITNLLDAIDVASVSA